MNTNQSVQQPGTGPTPDAGPNPSQPYMPASAGVSSRGSKKLWLIIGGVAAVVIVLVAVLGWSQMGAAKEDYKKAAVAYEQTVKTAFMYYHDIDDSNAKAAQITTKFDDAIATQPKQPTVWGLKVSVPADSVKRVDELANATRELRTSFKNLHDFNDYGVSVLTIMNDARGTLSTPADLKAMQPKVKTATAFLKDLHTPAGMEDFHTAKVNAYQAMGDDIDAALAALDSGNSTAYTTAVQKLATDAKAASITTAEGEINDRYDSYLGKLSETYDKLATLLNIKD